MKYYFSQSGPRCIISRSIEEKDATEITRSLAKAILKSLGMSMKVKFPVFYLEYK